MRELNGSYKLACLQCSFSDKELSEFIQWKKRNTHALPVKYAVAHVGLQVDGTWVLGSNAYFSPDGKEIAVERCQHVWIGDMYEGMGVAKDAQQCELNPSTTINPASTALTACTSACNEAQFLSLCSHYGRYSHYSTSIFFFNVM